MSKLAVAVTPSMRLRKSQAALYQFIVENYNSGKTITISQVVEKYSKYGCRNFIGDKPAYYKYDWKEHRQYLVELDREQLQSYAIQWFIRNLGIFVVKGLLTAIPTIKLTDLEIVPEVDV